MSGHNRAFELGQNQQGVAFDGKFLHFKGGVPNNGLKGFGKGALAIDSNNGAVYINQGSVISATWVNVSQSSGYMSDPMGVAPLMYSGAARVQIFGDSVHNWNTAFDSDTGVGFRAFTASYMRKWQPNKWAGSGVPMTAGSSDSGLKQTAGPGTSTTNTVAAKPGSLANYPLVSPSTVVTAVSGSLPVANYGAGSSNQRIAQPGLMHTPFDTGEYQVGRGQTFANGSATNSTCWFNSVNQPLRYVHGIYRPSSGGGTALVTRTKNTGDFTPSPSTDATHTLSASDGWDVIITNSDNQADNVIDQSFGMDIRANSSGTFYNTHSRIYNPAITDGMEINYMGGGGWSYNNHGANNFDDAIAADGVTYPWYSDAAQQQMFTDFSTNVAYNMILNGSPSIDSTWLPIHIQRLRDNFAIANNGETLKILVVSPYATGSNGTTRADNLAKICNQESVSFLDFHQKLADSGTDYTNIAAKLTDGVHPTEAFADEAAELIWDVIASTSS